MYRNINDTLSINNLDFVNFVKEHPESKSKYTEDDIINMLEFLVDNIFVVFGVKDFQQIVSIPMTLVALS